MKLLYDSQSTSNFTVEQLQLAFQLWVAYDLYGRCEEESASQLRCPLIGCSVSFESLGSCLQHLTTCAWLSNSWYWCAQCQRPERFAEAQPALINRPRVEPAHKSAITWSAAARFWRHIRNKSCHPSLRPSLPMIPSRREFELDTLDPQPLQRHGIGFWDPSTFYHYHSAVVGTKDSTMASPHAALKTSPYRLDKHDPIMQRPELESPSSDTGELDGWSNQRQELESPLFGLNTWTTSTQRPELDSRCYGSDYPTSTQYHSGLGSSPSNECSELQGGQFLTERCELMGSPPSYTETQETWPFCKHNQTGDSFQPMSSWDPTANRTFNASSSIADSPPFINNPTQLFGSSFQPSEYMPTGFSQAGQECPHANLAINTVSSQQSTPFDQSLYKPLPSRPKFSSTDHDHKRANTTTSRPERESSGKTLRWHKFRQSDPLANCSDIAAHNNPRCSYEPLLDTMSAHTLVNPVPYPSNEPYPAMSSRYRLLTDDVPEPSPISSWGISHTTVSPSSSTIFPVSSHATSREYHAHRNNESYPISSEESSSPPGSSSSSDKSFTKTSVSSSSSVPTPTEGYPVASWKQQSSKTMGTSRCPKCMTEFTGSFQDRKQNMKRHWRRSCAAHDGPRERFKCSADGCKKDYSRLDNLAKHCQKEHQGVRHYSAIMHLE